MKNPQYQQTPSEIMNVLHLFTQHQLSYILFKCEHIFEGQNKNLDILFETDQDYQNASSLLQQHGFVIRLSEKIERYKTMYCGFVKGVMYSIHLHREIAWHGMIALDKHPVFRRAQQVHPLIKTPGLEDSILIHAAHVLFENFKVRGRERDYFNQLNEDSTDKDYIRWQICKNRWEEGFWRIVTEERISKAEIAKAWIKKIWKDPATIAYLSLKALRIPLRKLSFKRRGCWIALIGVNGSGKTTLAKKVLEEYRPITSHLGTEQQYYYYGWKPTFIVTRWLSALLKRRGKEIFKEVNIKAKPPRFDLFQEMQFLYIYFEFLYRYYAEIRPLLRKGDLIITDRYFYDLYGQYPYGKNSPSLKYLIRIFPKPTAIYHLTTEVEELQNRKKTEQNIEQLQTKERTVLPEGYLKQQQENYAILARRLKIRTLNTGQDIKENIDIIINETWNRIP